MKVAHSENYCQTQLQTETQTLYCGQLAQVVTESWKLR
jgi:hypothetical protein